MTPSYVLLIIAIIIVGIAWIFGLFAALILDETENGDKKVVTVIFAIISSLLFLLIHLYYTLK